MSKGGAQAAVAKERLTSSSSDEAVRSMKSYSSNAADASNLSVFENASEVSGS
jgi:hypothetical protein